MAGAMKKYMILIFIVLLFVSIILISYKIYKIDYLKSYRQLDLVRIATCENKYSNNSLPYWISLTTQEQINNTKQKYNINLPNIDLEQNMLIISYGSELIQMEYCLNEHTYKTRGSYIGFPKFGNEITNKVFFYKSPFVPLINTDVAGFSPEYIGKFR